MNCIFRQTMKDQFIKPYNNSFEKPYCSSDVKTELLIPRPLKFTRKLAKQLMLIVTSRMYYQLRKKQLSSRSPASLRVWYDKLTLLFPLVEAIHYLFLTNSGLKIDYWRKWCQNRESILVDFTTSSGQGLDYYREGWYSNWINYSGLPCISG